MPGVLGISWHAIKHWYYSHFCRLTATVLTEADIPRVQGFYCGSADWETYVADWLKSGEVIKDMKNPRRQTQTWLFWRRRRLVGFGSLGKTRRPIPAGTPQFVDAAIIPFFGVDKDYHGKPRYASRDDRYAGQIMNHLIHHARQFDLPYLCLYVDPENDRAKGFYRKFEFEDMGRGKNNMDVMAIRLA
jgi:ribosomal protein S18 acetylase RimI-like enzyme